MAVALLACVASAGCDRVFGVEGTHSTPADARRPLDVIAGAYSEAVLADQPLAYYQLDEVAGPVANDTLGRVNGTYIGDVMHEQSPSVLSEPGTSIYLNQSDLDQSGIQFEDHFDFDGTKPFTLELWIFPAEMGKHDYGNVISKWSQPNMLGISSGYIMYVDYRNGAAMLIFARDDVMGKRAYVSTPVRTDGWSHVVGAYDGTMMTLSINGEVRGIEPSSQVIPPGTPKFVIGSANGGTGTNPFRGQMDDVAIYDHGLTPVQAKAHFDAAGVAD
jgi:hypothetical protein